MSAGQEAVLSAWQAAVDRIDEDFADDGKPLAIAVVSEREELVALRALLESERKAGESLVQAADRRAELAEANLATAMRFILGDKARATAWASRGDT
jgi:hypothetical protein